MTDSRPNYRELTLRALAMLSETYSHSTLARKLESDDQRTFEQVIAAWSKGIKVAGITTAAEIDTGLDAVLKSGSKFEPSIPEFTQLCTPKRLHPSHRPVTSQEAERDADKLLPPPVAAYGCPVKKLLGESKQDYAMRCREYLRVNHSSYYAAIGKQEKTA